MASGMAISWTAAAMWATTMETATSDPAMAMAMGMGSEEQPAQAAAMPMACPSSPPASRAMETATRTEMETGRF